jgi:hypothetical protein
VSQEETGLSQSENSTFLWKLVDKVSEIPGRSSPDVLNLHNYRCDYF